MTRIGERKSVQQIELVTEEQLIVVISGKFSFSSKKEIFDNSTYAEKDKVWGDRYEARCCGALFSRLLGFWACETPKQ